MDPKPILVLGVNRSGTKWLSNEIARHPDVAAVAHKDHGGIIESNLLTDYGRSFDFSSDAGYQSFLDFWVRTDFFRLAAGSRDAFEPPNARPSGPVEAFRQLMDTFARARGAGHWLQKVSPLTTAYVIDHLPDAALVMISRKLNDTVRSRLKLDRDRKFGTSAFRAGFSISLQMRELRRVCRGRDVFVVRYEHLRADRDAVLGSIFDFLELGAAPTRDHAFPQNTSFTSDRERASTFGLKERSAVAMAWLAANLVPYPLLRRLRVGMTRARMEPLPGTFRQEEKQAPASD